MSLFSRKKKLSPTFRQSPDVTITQRLPQVDTNGGVIKPKLIIEPDRVPQLALRMSHGYESVETKLSPYNVDKLIVMLQEARAQIDKVVAAQKVVVHLDGVGDGTGKAVND